MANPKDGYRCENCGYQIPRLEGSYICPKCGHVLIPTRGGNHTKPISRRWWFWVLVILIIAVAIGNSGRILQFISGIRSSISISAPTDYDEKQSSGIGRISEKIDTTFSKSDCVEIEYKTLARNPDKYIDTPVKTIVKVTQILDGGVINPNLKYYVCYGYDEHQVFTRIDTNKPYVVFDYRGKDAEKILVDDIIEVYGKFNGTEKMTYAQSNTQVEVLSIRMMNSVLLEE